MKRNNVFLLSGLVLALSSCELPFGLGNITLPWESKSDSESISLSESNTSITNSESESEIMNTKVINCDDILLFPGEKYNIDSVMNEEYINEFIDYDFSDRSIITCDTSNNLVALKEGKADFKIYVNDELLQTVKVEVKSQAEVNAALTELDAPRVNGMNIVVFGDSITDNSVTAYPNNKPTFWIEMLEEEFEAKSIKNYAKSGSTVGYNHEMAGLSALNICSTFLINTKAVADDVKKADLVIIYIGTNDFIRSTRIGSKGEVDDSNYDSKESFIGSYYYLVNTIKDLAPNARVLCLSTTYSSWGGHATVDSYESRTDLNKDIKDIAKDTGSMFINLYDLWTSINENCPDGIHPCTEGYIKIFNKIFKTTD